MVYPADLARCSEIYEALTTLHRQGLKKIGLGVYRAVSTAVMVDLAEMELIDRETLGLTADGRILFEHFDLR